MFHALNARRSPTGFKPAQPVKVSRRCFAVHPFQQHRRHDTQFRRRFMLTGASLRFGTRSQRLDLTLDHPGQQPFCRTVRRAVDWLMDRQLDDGGWGEDCASYWHRRRSEVKTSTPSQTAWAVLALMAAGEVESEAVRRGIAYLLEHPREGARWTERHYTGTGFPRVFYLKYHGYAAYFPLWAVARYRSLMRRNDRTVQYGI